MAAAAAVDDSTSCASSSTTRHHVKRVSGVGMISYFLRCLLAREKKSPSVSGDAAGAWCRSLRSVSYVVSTTSARARSSAETGALIVRERFLASGPEAPRGCPSYVTTAKEPGAACLSSSERHCARMADGHTTSVAPHGPDTKRPARRATHRPHVNGTSSARSRAARAVRVVAAAA